MTSTSKKMIVLNSADGESFEIEEAVAIQSQTIKHLIEDDCADAGIPLPNVTGKILAKVIEYCKRHSGADSANVSGREGGEEIDLKSFDSEFVKVDQDTLNDILMAANYMNIVGLLDLTCEAVADMIKDKSHGEIRKLFGIRNDFTQDEEEQIRRENA